MDECPKVDQSLTNPNVGGRTNRNIRDNIFAVNAITNSILNGNCDAIDI